ncbi:MAG: esterase/lipase family protein, partial [Microthrixaceae bacterium]
ATGATEVDLVGHSEGTAMPQYYLKRLGGADEVRRYVAITPLYDGSTGWGVDRLIHGLEALPFGIGDAFRDGFETACGACRDALHGSTFNAELYADGVTAVPGVEYTTILSNIDEIVTPWQSGLLDAPNATNHVLQDGCPQDRSEHLAAAVTPRAMGIMLNALDPEHAVEPPCVPTIYALGYLG